MMTLDMQNVFGIKVLVMSTSFSHDLKSVCVTDEQLDFTAIEVYARD